MSVLDVIREASGYVGVVGGGLAGAVLRRFKNAERSAKLALTKAAAAFAKAEAVESNFATLQSGLRMELTQFKDDIGEKLREFTRGSKPDQFFDERRFDDLHRSFDRLQRQYEELKSDLVRERGQRHSLQQEIQTHNRGEAESWRELERTLGRIESQIESYNREMTHIRDLLARR